VKGQQSAERTCLAASSSGCHGSKKLSRSGTGCASPIRSRGSFVSLSHISVSQSRLFMYPIYLDEKLLLVAFPQCALGRNVRTVAPERRSNHVWASSTHSLSFLDYGGKKKRKLMSPIHTQAVEVESVSPPLPFCLWCLQCWRDHVPSKL
jgi:hypothetical protein